MILFYFKLLIKDKFYIFGTSDAYFLDIYRFYFMIVIFAGFGFVIFDFSRRKNRASLAHVKFIFSFLKFIFSFLYWISLITSDVSHPLPSFCYDCYICSVWFCDFSFFEEEKSSLPRPYTLGISNVTLHFFGIPPPELHVSLFCGFGTLPREKTILSSRPFIQLLKIVLDLNPSISRRLVDHFEFPFRVFRARAMHDQSASKRANSLSTCQRSGKCLWWFFSSLSEIKRFGKGKPPKNVNLSAKYNECKKTQKPKKDLFWVLP